jgi:signal transduction histidine kinase
MDDQDRLDELKSYSILDTLPEDDYDNLTMLASEICQTPISLVSLVDKDRQWFKSKVGLSADETPVSQSFCAHAIIDPSELFMIKDAREDHRFSTNPLVTDDPYIVFYAGIPLITENGFPLGTLCVIDREPRVLTDNQVKSLRALSTQVMKLMELRKSKQNLEQANVRLKQRNEALDKFAQIAAHDIRSPLTNIQQFAGLLSKTDVLDDDHKKMIQLINDSSESLSKMVNGLLEYAKADHLLKMKKEDIPVEELKKTILSYHPEHVDFLFRFRKFRANKIIITQILLNLISNAFKYNDKEKPEIEVGGRMLAGYYEFFVADNGPGIEPRDRRRIFDQFEVLQSTDRYGNFGTGMGLALVKRLVEELGGEINLESTVGQGSIFSFAIPM